MSHAVVTGTSSGIGQAIARRLLDGGWHVTGFDLAKPTLDHAAFNAVTLDITDAKARTAALDAAEGVTALVHAAGIMRGGKLGELDLAAGETLGGCMSMPRSRCGPARAAPGRRRPHRVDRQPCGAWRDRQEPVRRSQSGACRPRAGLGEGARAARHHGECRRAGGNRDRDADRPGASRHSARGSPADWPPHHPEEVAALVAFLLSEEAAAITGQEIAICGGASL